MKFFLFKCLLIVACFSSSNMCNAQHNVIKVDGLSLIIPDLMVFRPSYERNFGKYMSLSLNFEIGKYATGTSGTIGGSLSEVYSLKGWGLMPEFRVYPFGKRKDAPLGIFFGTHLRHRFLRESYQGKDHSVPFTSGFTGTQPDEVSVTVRGSLTELGLHAGYKGKIGQFVFEPLIGLGAGFVSGFSPNERKKIDPFHAEPINSPWHLLRVQFSIGFVFPEIEL